MTSSTATTALEERSPLTSDALSESLPTPATLPVSATTPETELEERSDSSRNRPEHPDQHSHPDHSGHADPGPLTYRILPPEEWDKLAEIEPYLGYQLPLHLPDFAAFAVAEDSDGRILGFLCLQLAYHAEPLHIHPDGRNHVRYLRLWEEIKQNLFPGTPFFVFTENGRVGKMAKRAGMKQLPVRVWQGMVGNKEGRRRELPPPPPPDEEIEEVG